MSQFLNLFERQLMYLKILKSKWIVYFISVLPRDIANLMVKETNDDSQDYEM